MAGGDFYTTAAQVIPLIFVAIAFEGRAVWKPELWREYAVSPHAMAWIRGTHMGVTTFFLVLGEATALWALGNNAPVSFEAGYSGSLIVLSLGVGGIALIAQVSTQVVLETTGEKKRTLSDRRARVALRVLLGWIVLGSAAIAGYLAWTIVTSLSN